MEEDQNSVTPSAMANPISQGDVVSRMQMQRSDANSNAKGIATLPDQMNMATSIDSQSSLALYDRKVWRQQQRLANQARSNGSPAPRDLSAPQEG